MCIVFQLANTSMFDITQVDGIGNVLKKGLKPTKFNNYKKRTSISKDS